MTADGSRDPLAGVSREVDAVLGSVELIRDATVRIASASASLRRDDLAALRPGIEQLLRRHEGFTAGAGVVLAPGVLTDASRWIEWWWADRGSGLERLEVDLDPDSAEFYDYTTTEWYRGPERTGSSTVAGPYVDYICTHRYTFTLSVPIVQAGRFLGVAGADVLAEEVERAVLPSLARLGRVVVLASANGRVIASNAARFPPGVVLDREEGGVALVPAGPAGASLPWVLLEAV